MSKHMYCGHCGAAMIEGKTKATNPIFDRDTGVRDDGDGSVWVCGAWWASVPRGTTIRPYLEDHDYEWIGGGGILGALRRMF